MGPSNTLTSKNKVLIYEGAIPLIITPDGIMPISQADLTTFRKEVNKSEDIVNSANQLTHIVYVMKQAYQAALNISSRPSLGDYHLSSIQNAHHQFEEVETTLSHLYRKPHKALGNRAYGEALCDKLAHQLKPNARVLEVGCGTGYLANSFLSRLRKTNPECYESIQYTMFDLSSALQIDQKKNCSDHCSKISFVQGDIQNHLLEGEFDLIISNEMIADLEVSPAKLANITNRKSESLAEELALKYSLSTESAPPLYLVNTGAINFVEKINSLLKVDGVAFISEFGNKNDFPVAVKLSGHYEHSIRFRDLVEVAEKNNLKARLETVGEFLNFDKNYEVLSRDSYALLSDFLLPHLGIKRLERLPYDREMIFHELGDMTEKILNLRYFPLKEQRDLLNPYRFMALQIQK